MADAREVRAAANSAPSGRDYRSEIDLLLAKADELREEAEAMDMASAANECLERGIKHSLTAQELGETSAASASEKIASQQDRFKTSLIVDGIDLDDELVESAAPRPVAVRPVNKYSQIMNSRKEQQLQGSSQVNSTDSTR
ncbi:hypothetical protein AB1Y20_018654 [Prymnesium parvum]|uniref:Uncharacterized protein n=1 Tax=Prymnesium parvum TaxID=97485 RepID=A0AB34JNU6_PRYPA